MLYDGDMGLGLGQFRFELWAMVLVEGVHSKI